MKSRIKELAEAKGISLVKLAKDIGITNRGLYKYEHNGLAKAQFGCMVRIAKALDCKLEDLYEGEDDD